MDDGQFTPAVLHPLEQEHVERIGMIDVVVIPDDVVVVPLPEPISVNIRILKPLGAGSKVRAQESLPVVICMEETTCIRPDDLQLQGQPR